MLVKLGQRKGGGDVVDLLSECHARIRRFLEMAARLATAPDAPAASASETAGQIRRYFDDAFPLHLADEDELVLPRLFGTSAAVDDALARMHAEHEEHAPLVVELSALCAAIHADPQKLAASAQHLAQVTAALHAALEDHLVGEEQVIFPALRGLPADELAAIHAGMRDRRDAILRAAAQARRP